LEKKLKNKLLSLAFIVVFLIAVMPAMSSPIETPPPLPDYEPVDINSGLAGYAPLIFITTLIRQSNLLGVDHYEDTLYN